MRLIVAGIHTDVGKTVVSAILTEALQGHYWKPVQCGLPKDCDWVQDHLSLKERCFPSSYFLKTPCSPHLAAPKEGLRVEAKALIPPVCNGPLIIEGTGGVFSPLNEKEVWADAAENWDGQWIIVYRPYLGSFNHFFLTLEAIKKRKLPLLGCIFNGDVETEEMLLERAGTRCVGRLKWEEKLTPAIVKSYAKQWRDTIGV